jgi:hypothetical protein
MATRKLHIVPKSYIGGIMKNGSRKDAAILSHGMEASMATDEFRIVTACWTTIFSIEPGAFSIAHRDHADQGFEKRGHPEGFLELLIASIALI